MTVTVADETGRWRNIPSSKLTSLFSVNIREGFVIALVLGWLCGTEPIYILLADGSTVTYQIWAHEQTLGQNVLSPAGRSETNKTVD